MFIMEDEGEVNEPFWFHSMLEEVLIIESEALTEHILFVIVRSLAEGNIFEVISRGLVQQVRDFLYERLELIEVYLC